MKAKARLKELVASDTLDLKYVRCSCKPGTEHTIRCNHGRGCGVLTSNGRNVGDILVEDGLAVPFAC
jgi:micrococcal nuclease